MTTFERSLRKYVLEALKPLDACAVENSACPGFPDVVFIGGEMELKVLPDWPRRPSTIVKVPKFRPLQRNWLRARWRAGGLALFLLRVDREHLLFEGEWAADNLGVDKTREELYAGALAAWAPQEFSRELLLALITSFFSYSRHARGTGELCS
jgi:hypothetical protein